MIFCHHRSLRRPPSAVSVIRIGFLAASLAVLCYQAMTFWQIGDSISLTRTNSMDASPDHTPIGVGYFNTDKWYYLSLPLNDPTTFHGSDDDDQHGGREIDTNPPDPTAFGACLMVKDDNDLLYEWLAYHYTMLPLGYVVVGSDLDSSQDPAVVLDRWHGLNITTWLLKPNDYINRHGDYHSAFRDTTANNRSNMSEKQQTMHHHHALIHRQKGFITTCLERLKTHGVGWTLLIDSDEFLVLNPLTPKEEEDLPMNLLPVNNNSNGQAVSIALQGRRMVAKAMEHNDPLSFRDVLESLTHLDPGRMSKCYTMPRLLVGALENETCPGVETTIDFARSVVNGRFTQLSTLRFFQHARKGDFARSKFGKVLLDLSAIDIDTIRNQVPANIHRPFRQYCIPAGGVNFADRYMYLLHYIGSWERYEARSDHRRNRIEWEKRSTVNDDSSACAANVTRWFHHFTKRVGNGPAKNLLGVYSALGTLSPF